MFADNMGFCMAKKQIGMTGCAAERGQFPPPEMLAYELSLLLTQVQIQLYAMAKICLYT